MPHDLEETRRRLADIRAITFSTDPLEVAATLHVVLNCYDADDDPEIIGCCKHKLDEGISKLKAMGEAALAQRFRAA